MRLLKNFILYSQKVFYQWVNEDTAWFKILINKLGIVFLNPGSETHLFSFGNTEWPFVPGAYIFIGTDFFKYLIFAMQYLSICKDKNWKETDWFVWSLKLL